MALMYSVACLYRSSESLKSAAENIASGADTALVRAR